MDVDSDYLLNVDHNNFKLRVVHLSLSMSLNLKLNKYTRVTYYMKNNRLSFQKFKCEWNFVVFLDRKK